MSEIDIARDALAKADAELAAPSVDWAATLGRTRRHVTDRLTRAAAIGGVGAILLLAGGLAARAADTSGGGGSSSGGPVRTSTEPTPQEKERKEEKEKKEERERKREHKERKEQEERRKKSGEELPNLTVSASEDSTDVFSVLVANDSTTPAGPFQVVATVSGRVVAEKTFEGLEAGASESLLLKCFDQALVVEVDTGGQVKESSEEDNRTEVECGEAETTEETTTDTIETTETPTTTETTPEPTEAESREAPR